MIKLFQSKKNITIAISLALGATSLGVSLMSLTKAPHCPPPPAHEMPRMELRENQQNCGNHPKYDCFDREQGPTHAPEHGPRRPAEKPTETRTPAKKEQLGEKNDFNKESEPANFKNK